MSRSGFRYMYVVVGLLGLVAVGIGIARYLPYAEASSIGANVDSLEELEQRFEELARKKGAAYAFQVLGRASLPPQTDLHLLGHVVGDVLYEQEGIQGMAVCTQDFRNACSHSMVVGALTDYGEAALDHIREACRNAPGGIGAYTMCYHGLGHGVFAYYGYEIQPTVALCEKTGTDEYRHEESNECIGGAIMEFAGGGGHDPVSWKESREKYLDDPIRFCLRTDMAEEAQARCLMYMTPEIWKEVGIQLAQPNPYLFEAAFRLCDSIPAPQQMLRDSCFGGFGKEFIPLANMRDIRSIDRMTDSQYALAIDWCLASEAEDGKRACIQSALESVFWGGENDPAASFRFCAQVPGGLHRACLGKLAENIARYVGDMDQRSVLCRRIPSPEQETCALPL